MVQFVVDDYGRYNVVRLVEDVVVVDVVRMVDVVVDIDRLDEVVVTIVRLVKVLFL